MHCIFENKYGSRFYYSWTAPWRDKEGEHGVERLFFTALEIEEWNDPEGAWSAELRKASKELSSLEEMKLPVKIQMGMATEHIKENEVGKPVEYSVVQVSIIEDEQPCKSRKQGDDQYISIGEVNMAWDSLKKELFAIREAKLLSKDIKDRVIHHYDPYMPDEVIGIDFWVWVEKAPDKTQYQVISRKIASCIRRFIRSRLSEYNALKKGFEEQG